MARGLISAGPPNYPVSIAPSHRPMPHLRDSQRSPLFTFVQSEGNLLANLTTDAESRQRDGVSRLTMKPKRLTKKRNGDSFNAQAFLDTAGVARKVMDYHRGESIYSQGDTAETVMYVQKGGVRLSVVNGSGKEAVVVRPDGLLWRGLHGWSIAADGHDNGRYTDHPSCHSKGGVVARAPRGT